MKILQNKFMANHRNSKCVTSMIFYMTTTTKTTARVTAAIVILMQIIASVNTAKTGCHVRPDTEITRTATATAAAAAPADAAVATVTWTRTFSDININPIIAQQKQPTKTQATTKIQPTVLKVFPILNSFHMTDATETMTQPKVRSTENSTLATKEGDCKSLTAAWGDIDPNVFYICDTQTKRPLQLRCPEGTGFFLGLGYSGCIPFEQWPACLSTGYVEQVSVCDSEHMQQPWECKNPNKFHVCLRETIEPTILNCEPGKGFVHAIVTTSAGSRSSIGSGGSGSSTRDLNVGAASAISEIVGCTNWEKWRNYMQCNNYY